MFKIREILYYLIVAILTVLGILMSYSLVVILPLSILIFLFPLEVSWGLLVNWKVLLAYLTFLAVGLIVLKSSSRVRGKINGKSAVFLAICVVPLVIPMLAHGFGSIVAKEKIEID